MHISLNVDSPREAGYAVSMFQALRGAMLTDPPPAPDFSQTHQIGGVSHAALTAAPPLATAEAVQPQRAFDSTAADQDIDQETDDASGGDTAVAVPGKKRGRRTKAEIAAAAAAKAAAEEHALRPGAALQGVDAMTLAQALEQMPLVQEVDGVQVRTAPGTPPDEIAAMQARLQAQDDEIRKEREAQAAAEAEAAAKADAERAAAAEAAKVVTLPAAAAKPASPIDDDLAALFRSNKPEAPQHPAGSRFAVMDHGQLMSELIAYINGRGGLFWARSMMSKLGIEAMEDITAEQLRHVLENPDHYKPAA
jgi:hypothetical protein